MFEMPMDEHHEDVKSREWERQQPLFDKIRTAGFEAYVKSLPDAERLFALRDHNLRCIDEGTPGGLHAAGSGILMEKEAAAQFAKAAEVDGVWSHEGCGAAALFTKEHGQDPKFSDQIAQSWAKELARRLNVPYRGHVAKSELRRPSEFHNARVVYYDKTGRFDPSASPDVPNGFVVTRRYNRPENAARDLDVAIFIALGDHGFGENLLQKIRSLSRLSATFNPGKLKPS